MTQLRLRYWPGMRLTWVDGCAVVHTGSAPSAGAMAVVSSSSSCGEASVVVGSHTVRMLPAMIDELAEALSQGLQRGTRSVRMVAWDSGCSVEDRAPAAHVLATRLGLDVLAPAGPLLGVPGGSLFAPFGRGPQRPGGWWRFAPGAAPALSGWRFPAPPWEADLGDDLDLAEDLVLDQVPAGVWLHRPGHRSATDLVYSVPIDPQSPALVLSHPSETPLLPDELAKAVNRLPRRAAERVILTPYGKEPVLGGRLGEIGASVLGHTVRVRPGLPLCAPAGGRAVVSIDGNGVPRWRPFARELQYAPRRKAPGVVDFANPAPGYLGAQSGPATFDLENKWVVEIIEPGLWIRPAQLPEPAEWIRALPLDVGRCVVVLGAPFSLEPLPSSNSIAALLEHLPGDARTRVRLIVPRGTPGDVYHLASNLRGLLPGVSDVLVLGSDERSTVTTGSIPVIRGFGQTGAHPVVTHPVVGHTNGTGAHPVVHQGTGAHPLVGQGTGAFRQVPTQRQAPPSHAAPTHAAPNHAAPNHAAPSHAAPSHAAPSHAAPGHATPPAAAPPTHQAPQPQYATPPPIPEPDSSDGESGGRREVRSHRPGDKPSRPQPETDRHDTKELQRLLGFFDEIRRAKAWDEDPEWGEETDQHHHQAATRRR